MPQPSSSPGGRRGASPEPPAGPQPCSACRATGTVIATRGGEQATVACPWCQGTGSWEPGHDAQASGVFPGA